ncbi:hypothetical protein [Rhodococcoides fascians]|uniref:hypothetical protein n=1 Tax=Rhodococcoides fascians TaxID=1828 RepID=UPI001114E127|nr:hypothetical protein [Rhodococcus fascians]
MDPTQVFAAVRMFAATPTQMRRAYHAVTPGSALKISLYDSGRDFSYFVPRVPDISSCNPPEAGGALDDPNVMNDWVAKHQVLPFGSSEVSVLIQTADKTSAVVRALRVESSTAESVPGIVLSRQIGGPIEALSLNVNLDNGSVTAVDSRILPTTHLVETWFTVSPQEPLAIRLAATSSGPKALVWQLVIEVTIDGKRAEIRIPESPWIAIPHNYDAVVQRYLHSGSSWAPAPD